MPIHGEVCIFRMTNYTDTEASITTDKIEFDGDAEVPDGLAKIQRFNFSSGKTETQNDAPYQERTRKPDTGWAGAEYMFYAYFDQRAGKSLALKKLIQWTSEEGTLDGRFRDGRIGLRNNYLDELDLVPTREAGYKVSLVQGDIDLSVHQVLLVPIKLTFSGDAMQLKANKSVTTP